MPRRRPSRRLAALSPALWLVAISLAIIVAFLVATVYTQGLSRGIDAQALKIGGNAVPSVADLSDARSALARLVVLAGDAIDETAQGRRYDPRPIDALEAKMIAALTAYRSYPPYPGETPLYQVAANDIAALDAAVRRLLARLEVRDLTSARLIWEMEVAPGTEHTDADLGRLVHLNAAEARQASLHIRTVRDRAKRIAYLLNGIVAVLAVVGLSLSVFFAWRHARAIDERNRLAEERASELEQFAGRVAHDLRAPLQVTLLRMAAARRQPAGPDRERSLDAATGGLRRMNLMIDGLLEFARAGARQQAEARADVVTVIRGVLDDARVAAEQTGARLQVEPVPPIAAACTPGALASVLSNLVDNALKYMQDAPERERRLTLRVSGHGSWARFEVEDTGPGVPAGQEAAIFEPFARLGGSAQPGLGLGLATVKRIVEAHGGRVGVQPAPGRGSLFWFELPLAS